MRLWTVLIVSVISLFVPACASPIIETFDITPAAITTGQSATLTWKVDGVSSVIIEPLGTLPPSGTRALTPTTTTIYTLTAAHFTGTISRALLLNVSPQPISIEFKLDPAMLISNGVANLSWNVTGATTVNIDQGIGVVSPSGNRTVNPAVTTVYTLTAVNAGSNVSGSVTLVVNPPVNVRFSATPTATSAGQGSLLQWNVTGAQTISISPDIGNVPASGSRGVFPSTTTTYSLTATSSCCQVTESVSVIVGDLYPYFPYYIYRYPFFGPP